MGILLKSAHFDITALPDDPLALSGDIVGRLIVPHYEPDECASKVIAWLHECQTKHQNCRRPLVDQFATCSTNDSLGSDMTSEITPLPPRLVEVGASSSPLTLYLKDTQGLRGQYCALSYSWGRSTSFKTTKSTYKERLDGFPLNDLPTTIRDAVILTRRLGFRFLWVDALCIVQDDGKDWALNSAMMDQIYGHATLTIAASACEDKWNSLYPTRERFESVSITSVCHSDDHSVEGAVGTMVITERESSLEAALDRCPLASRAWTLQERALSRRTIHFAKDRMYWECKKHCAAENSPTFKPAMSANKFLTRALGQASTPTFDQMLAHWWYIVEEYSRRNLFASSDKLPALAGLARQFHQQASASFLAGLWVEDLPLGLLWTRDSLSVDGDNCPKPEWRAPSWSWASIEGPLSCRGFRLNGIAGRTNVEMLEILASKVTLKEQSSPFGEVKSGVLRVYGKLQRASRGLEKKKLDYGGFLGIAILGYPVLDQGDGMEGDEVRFDDAGAEHPIDFLCLLVERGKDDKDRHTCAFLVIEEVDRDHYKRIGLGIVRGRLWFDSSEKVILNLV